jgi:hypothetical protein
LLYRSPRQRGPFDNLSLEEKLMLRGFLPTGAAVIAALSAGWGLCRPAGAAAGELPALNLADVPAADLSAGWGEASRDGDVSYRPAAKGGRRMVKLKAWWPADSLRPPENTVWVFEVRYRDVPAAPVVFHSHGGLGRYHAPGEVHRFGGSGDGKWKTAAVPVGSDQLIRLRDRREMTAFGVSAEADLPVASVKVRPATAADEARYNAETRAWIAAVQAEKARRAPLKVKPPDVKLGRPAGMAAFPCPALVPLLPDARPQPRRIGAPIEIRMCLNEIEGGAFGVYAHGADLTNVRYEVSPLTSSGGRLAADVTCRTAEYCLVPMRGGLRRFPQRLWPAYKVDIPKGRSHWFVFNLRTRRGRTRPGTYTGTVNIASDQGRASLPVKVEVLPIDLLTMDEAGLLMGGCVSGLVPARDVAFQTDYNQNATNLWFAGVQPGMTLKRGRLELDFTYLDEWMTSARKRGLKAVVWFLGGDPYGWPDTVSILRDLARIDKTGDENRRARIAWVKRQAAEENRNGILPEQRPLFKQWVRQVTRHAREAGWPEIILTPFDEPAKWVQGPYKKKSDYPGVIGTGPWIKPFFKDCCAAIREAAPKTRIYASIHHNRLPSQEGICFLPDIDVFCTNAIHEDPRLGEKVRAAHKDFWQYSGVGGGTAPDRARYTFGFYFAAFDSRGSLCWAYNWGRGFDTTEGRNWMYAWQTPFGTVPAPYFEGMREAWDDRRIIETYKKRLAKDPAAMGALNSILTAAARSRARGGRDTVSDFWAAVDDAAKLDKWRNRLLDRLAKAR